MAPACRQGNQSVQRPILWLSLASLALISVVEAAPVARKPAPAAKRPAARPAQKPPVKPVAAKPAEPELPATPGIMVPKPVVLSRPTPAEQKAHAIWSLRTALNVAALQCQYSAYLRTVDNYNQMLRKHSGDLTAAQKQMIAHFARTTKAGPSGFDRYNTRSYNSFSTLDAQYNFCWAAGRAGLAVRMANVGAMADVAEAAIPELRAALSQVPRAAGLIVPPAPALPDFSMREPIIANN